MEENRERNHRIEPHAFQASLLFTEWTFQSLIISMFIFAWQCFIKNLKGMEVSLITSICSVGKENRSTLESQPWSLS